MMPAFGAYTGGLDVRDVSLVWTVRNGLPYEKLWRITFRAAASERADEVPGFVNCYRASEKGQE